MNTMEVATAIADRAYVGWSHCGPALHRKIKIVAINLLAAHEPEARQLERDACQSEREARDLERKLAIAERTGKGTSAGFRVTVASLKLSHARVRREAADVAVDHATLVLAIKQWESRTGLDHSTLLTGVYGKPLGDA